MAVACPICKMPPWACSCMNAYTKPFIHSASAASYWYAVYGTNGEPELKEHEIPLEEWISKLKQFVDLPTEYPEEWEKRTDIQIYLEAIHELDNESLYWMLVWVNSQIEETPLGFYSSYLNQPSSYIPKQPPIRSITVLDAFIIREYTNRLIKQKNKELEQKRILESKRSLIYQEEWYKNFDDKYKYRLETAVEHRLEQRMYEEQGNEQMARIAYENFHKALAYEQAELKYFVDEFIDYSQKRNIESALNRIVEDQGFKTKQQLFKHIQNIKRRGK